MDELIQKAAVLALPVVFAITLREAVRAYVANFFGDETAYQRGRMSLNPAKHIDPFGTLLIPLVLYLLTGGAFLFGYAKTTPVNFENLGNPKRDMGWIVLAGPIANLIMAVLWSVAGIVLHSIGYGEDFFFIKMTDAGVWINVVVLAFNLFPVPPLDGGRILVSVLPYKYAYRFAQIEPYGFFIVMGLVMLNVLQVWLVPVINIALLLVQIITSPLSILLGQ